MTFVSYAQNFEDVLLWRALRGVDRGFYIDVGAAHPDIDSVTRAFYDRGWSGINIEPTPEHSLRLAAARPRDVNLQLVLGERAGRKQLFIVDGTGLSTTDKESLGSIRSAGMDAHAADVAAETLANVCRAHAAPTIHFLKIDVEGAEAAVLSGADFVAFRPWIVIVEATAPMTTDETHSEWDWILRDTDYHFVWFDGLNRFYVSSEMHDELKDSFRTPPNVFDNFLRAADSEWARRIHEAESRLDILRERLPVAENRAEQLLERAVSAEARAGYEALAAAHARLRCDDATRDVMQLRESLRREVAKREVAEAAAAAQAERSATNERRQSEAVLAFEAMRNSTSWRITAPMRWLRSSKNWARPALVHAHAATAPVPDAVAVAVSGGQVLTAPGTSMPYRTAVHQFHSGAATGDAITNSMLLTRTRLRAMGYRSEIFVTYRDEALAKELRLTGDLPQHEHYVLILRHSLGFDSFNQIIALSAPKILLYHNITPSELLQGDEVLQAYSVIGRQQLKSLRGIVRSSLADSEFNAIELRALGFSPVQVCETLFDIDRLLVRAASTPAAKDRDVFTVLFVGRIVRSKGQAELVDVFAAFRHRFGKPCRLVLVGRHDGSCDAYRESIEARIVEYHLADDVLFTGTVSDEDLHGWYKRADVYLSLSQHEGFGVPLVEAIAHDLPVLALAAGAVPYTLGPMGLLLDGTTGTVVDQLLELALSEEHRTTLARNQRDGLQRFRWVEHEQVLLQALAAAGAAPPPNPKTRESMAATMRVTVVGHVNGSYSLAMVNRSLALMLEAERPGSVRLLVVEGEPTVECSGVPQAEIPVISALIARPRFITGPNVVISQHYPVYVPADPGDLALAYFFWEESVVPPETIACLNQNFGGVLAPSRFVAKTLVDSGLSIPVRVVGFAPNLERFSSLAKNHSTESKERFTFLHVSSGFPRKGVDVLLEAYQRAFRRSDPVCLVVKVFPNPHNDIEKQIGMLRQEDSDFPEIILMDRDVDAPELLDLYSKADVMVLPTRGEGFNLPAAEAMAAGLPVIVTGFGGHTDFSSRVARHIDFNFAPSASHLAVPGSLWAEPDVEDLSRALRDAFGARVAGASPTTLPKPRSFAAAIIAAAADVLVLPPLQRPLRITWVSSWGVRCGVAEYSRHLVAAMGRSIGCAEITLLCDDRTKESVKDGRNLTVSPCWQLGLAGGASSLIGAVARNDPDVLVVQHQPGLISWSALAELVTAPGVAARPVALVLHTTQRILDLEEDERERLIEALRQVTRIIVHTVRDLNRLKDVGLIENTMMLLHGAPDFRAQAKPPCAKGRSFVIGCYGFFLPDKGIPQLLEAAARLRPDINIRVRLVNADYGSSESASEMERCRALAERHGLANRVEWYTEFMGDDESLRYLAGCDLIVLPYQRSKEGSSAALRMAIASGVPVAVTPLALFEEAEGAVYRFQTAESVDMAAGLRYLFGRPDVRQALRDQACDWLAPRGWPIIGTRFGGMLRGLHRAEMALQSDG